MGKNIYVRNTDELYHSDTYLGAEFDSGMYHFKYLSKKWVNGAWQYVYDKAKKALSNLTKKKEADTKDYSSRDADIRKLSEENASNIAKLKANQKRIRDVEREKRQGNYKSNPVPTALARRNANTKALKEKVFGDGKVSNYNPSGAKQKMDTAKAVARRNANTKALKEKVFGDGKVSNYNPPSAKKKMDTAKAVARKNANTKALKEKVFGDGKVSNYKLSPASQNMNNAKALARRNQNVQDLLYTLGNTSTTDRLRTTARRRRSSKGR